MSSRARKPAFQAVVARRYASLNEAAEYWSCSTWTIRRRIADGTLTGFRLGPRMLRVDLNELDAFRPIPTAGGAA
jgi:excisionase family DNA binding protein